MKWLISLAQKSSRIAAITALATLAAIAALPAYAQQPALQHIKGATIAAADLAALETLYSDLLGYTVRERGRVSESLAASWGAPRAAGRAYFLMSPDAAPEVFIRVVQTPAVADYRPLTTFGWNAIEIIVDDLDKLYAEVEQSAFQIIGDPVYLSGANPTIRAFQVVGPAAEVFYLASETGDRATSILPQPVNQVGRIFIMVLAGDDAQGIVDWYAHRFGLARPRVAMRPLRVVLRAQGMPPDHPLPIAASFLAEHGNLIEFDGYSERATERPRHDGELPPGVALASFTVTNLDALTLEYITPPQSHAGLAYGGRRAATTIGPTGELIELVEREPRE